MAGQALAIRLGGTSQTTPAGARAALGLKIGTHVQAYDNTLQALSALTTTGLLVRTGDGLTAAARTLTGTANQITVTNGDGISDNPTLSIPNTFIVPDDMAVNGDSGFVGTVDIFGATTIDDDFQVTGTAVIDTGLNVTGDVTVDAGSVTVSTTGSVPLVLEQVEDGAAVGPVIQLFRTSASPAVSDTLGMLQFIGRNNVAQDEEYASIYAGIVDPVGTTEDGALVLRATIAGTPTDHLTVQGGVTTITGAFSAPNIYTITESEQLHSRNLIVNPSMAVSQENGTTAGATTGYYAADQWFDGYITSTGIISFARVASVTPNKSTHRIRLSVTTADTSLAATEILYIQQNIEGTRLLGLGWGASGAKDVIVRFGIKAPAGTYSVALRNSAINRSYVQNFTISIADTDTEVTLIFPGDTSGTWLTDTGIGLGLFFGFAVGSNFQTTAGAWAAGNYIGTSSNSNGLGVNTNVFEIFDVGLYIDDEGTGIAPRFQANTYDFDLAECQRYYWRWNVGTEAYHFNGAGSAGAAISWPIQFQVPMRIVPTLSSTMSGGTFVNCTFGAWNQAWSHGARVYFSVTATGSFNYTPAAGNHLTASARM